MIRQRGHRKHIDTRGRSFKLFLSVTITASILLTSPAPANPNALKYRFALEIDAAYTSANTSYEGYTDWAGGFNAALRALESKIGTPYNDELVFYGFELYLYSGVAILDASESETIEAEDSTPADPANGSATYGNPDKYRTSEAECAIRYASETCKYITGTVGLLGGPEVKKLHPDQPWIIAGQLQRSYAVPGADPPNERLEQYDLVLTAYVGPPFVQFKIFV